MTIIDPDFFQRAPLELLFREATDLRHQHFGDSVEFCSIINIKSGHCTMDCRFCAQSGHYRTDAPEYPILDAATLRQKTDALHQQGVHRVGWVASGCAVNEDELDKIVQAVRPHMGGLCASLGQQSTVALRKLKNAGFTRYHHNLESSERFYPNICTTQHWRDRYDTVRRAKEIGLQVCSGGLFGLGETWQDRIDLATSLQDLQVDSVPINFLCPVLGTPLGNQPKLAAEEALRIVALFRIMLPKTSIRICGGRPQALGDRQSQLFEAGADALMTGDYLTTPGRSIRDDRALLL